MDVRIERYMAKNPVTVEAGTGVIEALRLMRRECIRHLPITDGRRLVGLVSERDLMEAAALRSGNTLTVADVMDTDVFTARETEGFRNIAAEMAKSRYGSVVVVNEKQEVVGIFTTVDALNLLCAVLEGGWTNENDRSDLEEWIGGLNESRNFY